MSEGLGVAPYAGRARLAAQRLAVRLGLDASVADVLHSSNNTIVHLPSCRVVAKVGTGSGSEALAFELEVARHLAERRAEIALPTTMVSAGPHVEDGLPVTLWTYLPNDPDIEVSDEQRAASLARLHGALADWPETLPDYLDDVAAIGCLVEDDRAMRKVPRDGLELLRGEFARVQPILSRSIGARVVLHGAPHLHNVLATNRGLRWIDFETCRRGPIEADYAYLGDAGFALAGIDPDRLRLAARMLRVSVAVRCWLAPDRHPRLREAADYHLGELRREVESG
jgi:Ser/Thr protein kinase RdoA (MazF antagonist)